MNPKLIVIDGSTYNSVDEMPEDVRRLYEQAMSSLKEQDGNLLADQNRNGIPDRMENTSGAHIVRNTIKVLMDGKEFDSLDDMPPDARAKYEQAMGMLDANKNGMPDFLEGMIKVQSDATPVSAGFDAQPASITRSPMSIESPTITPDTTNGWMLGLLAAFILLVCALGAVGLWYFFLR